MSYIDYGHVCSTLLANKSSDFVRYNDFFRDIKNKAFKRIVIYLHEQLIISVCNRSKGYQKNITLRYVGYNISKQSEFKNWLKCDSYMYPRMQHVFDLYSSTELKKAFEYLYKVNLVEKGNYYASTVNIKFPIGFKILPLVYCYMSLMSKFKKAKQIKNEILETLTNTPEMLKLKYEDYTKDELIDIIVSKQINRYELSKVNSNSPFFKMIIRELIDYKLPEALMTYLKYYNKDDKFFIENVYNNFFAEAGKVFNIVDLQGNELLEVDENEIYHNDPIMEIKDDEIDKDALLNPTEIKSKEKREILGQELTKLKNNGILLPEKKKIIKNPKVVNKDLF